ncbi:hypothetical protein [Thalassobacillus sp. C254]|nr:hypothetical protein [Thalassobacillus sp. C254]
MSVLLFKNKNVIVEGKVIEHTVPYREKFYQSSLAEERFMEKEN